MRLEGKTLIELTDVNTGQVEAYEDKNLVTNAIAQLFSLNPEAMLYCIQSNGGVNWNEYHLPICPNAIGGILLFSDTLTEDVNNLYAPSSNPCVGYASNNVNSSANTLRGSLNLNESGKITNGYKFVWDFATSQANGTISAVALTHKRGGVGYMGDPYDNGNRLLCMKTLGTGVDGIRGSWYVDAVELNFEGNYFISISMDTSNKVIVRKIRKCYTQVGLNFALHENAGDYILEEHILTPTTFLNPQASSNYGNIDFIDGKNGYWYGFIGGSNSSGNASVKWMKIKKSDYSFTEGTWTLNNSQIQQVGYRGGYNTGPYRSVYSVIRNGYVYFMGYSRNCLYKVALDNSADITKISLGFTSNFSNGDSYGAVYMYMIGDWICCSDFRINTEDEVFKYSNWRGLNSICTPLFPYGPFLLAFGRYSYSSLTIYKQIYVATPYLASINNLDTSVIKTADKTMKITYTITETE